MGTRRGFGRFEHQFRQFRALTSLRSSATMLDMQLKDFGKYLRGKSVAKLLHRARKESLKRITANAEDLELPARTPPLKRTGTR